MKEAYKNLAMACSIFSEEYDLSLDQNLASLDMSIKQGYIDFDELKKEFNDAIVDSNFDWLEFAVSNRLIVYNIEKYSDADIKNFVKSFLWNYLFPNSDII